MKISFVLFVLLFRLSSASGQDELIHKIRQEQDSILRRIELETDEYKRIELLLSIYRTRVESYPLMVIEVGQKLSSIAQKTKDPITEAISWGFFGQGYRLSGDYLKGLECHQKAVAIAESTGNKSLMAITQNQMAHIYKDREENEKALRLYRIAWENAKSGENKEATLWPQMNMGAVLLAMNQPDSALYYLQKAHEGSLKYFNLRNMSYILTNIAGAYSKMGKMEQARDYFNRAILAARESESPRYLNQVYTGLAEHFQRMGLEDSTLFYAKKAIHTTQNTLFTFLSIKPSKLLTEIYEKSNADSALRYMKIYHAANDSLFSARASQQLHMMAFEEDLRRRELVEEKIHYRNKIKMNLVLGGLGVFALIALILYRNNHQKQKANTQLLRQKEEIQSTLSQLESAQNQLIQSEKMASLGELTAGIAHEIQNPLNFVNNFAEVNMELIDEMNAAMEKGDAGDVRSIASDLRQNLEKIKQHGQRADGIVKGMLQHSRSSSGQKESTDLNALADEYLRLAYHGLRARDKSFNAKFETDFDPAVGKIELVPQDFGRVILNLISNAFYAVDQEAKKGRAGYAPAVKVSTQRSKGLIQIRVTDNGPGVPESIAEKIFQPFFTTKPSGKGTGLGLSLSYDIVKAHGGRLTLESREGEGSNFIIELPG